MTTKQRMIEKYRLDALSAFPYLDEKTAAEDVAFRCTINTGVWPKNGVKFGVAIRTSILDSYIKRKKRRKEIWQR